nr:hypothetical protein [Rhizorhabdus dicambivorans]
MPPSASRPNGASTPLALSATPPPGTAICQSLLWRSARAASSPGSIQQFAEAARQRASAPPPPSASPLQRAANARIHVTRGRDLPTFRSPATIAGTRIACAVRTRPSSVSTCQRQAWSARATSVPAALRAFRWVAITATGRSTPGTRTSAITIPLLARQSKPAQAWAGKGTRFTASTG